jgi:hypothetical protein
MIKNMLIALLLVGNATPAQDSFVYRCPKGDAHLPVSCLERMKVQNVNKDLTPKQHHQLAYLFIKSYVVSKVKYNQDYPVDPTSPIAKLLITNFPEAGKIEKEGGLWLRDIFNIFRSKPEYQVDVQRAMKNLTVKQRKQIAS